MDPIIASIISGVAWFFLGSIVAVIIFYGFFGLSIWLAVIVNQEWIAPAGIVVGWIAAILWEIFVWVQIIISIVTVIQLLT